MNKPPLCKECRFAKPDPFLSIINLWMGNARWRIAACLHPNSNTTYPEVEYTTGEKSEPTYMLAATMRRGQCGKEGTLFERRK